MTTRIHTSRQQMVSPVRRGRIFQSFSTMIVLLAGLFIYIPSAFAQGTLSLDLTAIDPVTNLPPQGTLQTGQLLEYVIDFSCSSTSGDCGALSIDFLLDSEVIFEEVIAPPSYTAIYNPVTNTVEISKNPFEDAEAGQVTVRVRIGQDLDDFQIDATLIGSITNGPGNTTQEITAPGSPITIEEPSGGWTTSKAQTTPSGGLGPTSNGIADYRVQACPTPGATGIARFESVTIVDRFPPGAIPSNISGGGVVSDQLDSAGRDASDPGFTGLDGVNDTITWTLNFPAPNYHTSDDGCVTVNYRLTYPAVDGGGDPLFPIGTPIPNNYSISANTPDEEFPNLPDCPNCVGTGGTGGDIDPPSVTTNTSKSGPGINAVLAPSAGGANDDGLTPFTIDWDLNVANVATDNFTVTDIFPLAFNEAPPRPIFDVIELNSGAWDDGHIAEWEYLDNLGNWQLLQTLNGAPVTLTAGFPTPIYGVRWRFTGAIPAGFSPTTSPTFWVLIPMGLNAQAYDDGGNPRTYQNCATFAGTYQDENDVTQNITAPNACTNFRVGNDVDDGFANITTTKGSNPQEVFPTQDIQFTLTVNLTQEASGALINPFIEDILPYGMQIVRLDSVEFINTVVGDTTPTMHLAVERLVNGGTNPITGAPADVQRLVFFWSERTPAQLRTASAFPADSATNRIFACGATPCTIDTNINDFDLTGTAPLADVNTANALEISAPGQSTQKTIRIRFTAQARADTPAGNNDGTALTYENSTTVVSGSVNLICQAGGGGTDTTDIDRDGNTAENICSTSANYRIREAAQISGSKWIRSLSDGLFTFRDSRNLDIASPTCETTTYQTQLYQTGGGALGLPVNLGNPVFTRFPCVAQGRTGEGMEYLIRLQNTGLTSVSNFILYDILPHVNDTGVSQAISGEQRNSEFRTFLTGPIVLENPGDAWIGASGFTYTVQYYVGVANINDNYLGNAASHNPYRPQMSTVFDNPLVDWSGSGGSDANWVLAGAVANWQNVTAFRIVQTGGVIPTGSQLIFSSVATISNIPDPADPTQQEAETGEIGWNSFSHRYTNAFSGRRLLTAAPRKVGIVVDEVYSLGNRIWIDDGAGGGFAGDGIKQAGEPGINGVAVELYRNGALYATDVTRQDTSTGEDGYYFFGNLPGGNANTYYVRVAPVNFQPGGALEPYISSNYTGADANAGAYQAGQSTTRVDSRDNGRDPANRAAYLTDGVRTMDFTLTRTMSTVDGDVNRDNTNPDGSPPSNEGPLGRGQNNEQDSYSDLTRDFGFYTPMSVGNRVWRDDGAQTGAPNNTNLANFNDGILNGNEVGIGGVTMQIWRDTTNNGTPDTLYRTMTTDNTAGNIGYYLFDALPAGTYEIRIPATNFNAGQPLNGLVNSFPALTPGGANPDDSVNHRRGTDANTLTPVRSAIFTLTPGPAPNEPTNETDFSNNRTFTTPNGTGTDGWGRWGEQNQNSNLTYDFGFVPPSMSLGNRIWIDDGAVAGGFNPAQFDDGILNGAEVGVQGVTVRLLYSDGVTPVPNPLNTAINYEVTTDVNGYYLFDRLPPGNYIVDLPASNFGVGAPLENYFSSTATINPPTNAGANNNNDHGINVADPSVTGVRTGVIALVNNTEPTGEDPENPTTGFGRHGEVVTDNNSRLTIDLGFVRPMAIGNRVWLDNATSMPAILPANADKDNPFPGDGIIQTGEVGVDGVTVQLYYEGQVIGTDTPIASTVTANGGYYLFDRQGANQADDTARRLGAGNYIVHIPASNFGVGQPLANHISSDNGGARTDGLQVNANNDSGLVLVDIALQDEDGNNLTEGMPATYPVTAGVSSGVIQLRYDDEPQNEVDRDPTRPTFNGRDVLDINSNLTVDFAFYIPDLSIGNFVWIDDGGFGGGNPDYRDFFGNGIYEPAQGELGRGGVIVNLYNADAGGNPIGGVLQTKTTDATAGNEGFYLFDNLNVGRYVVQIAPENFQAGGALEGYGSSIGNYADPTVANARDNSRDNGIDNPNPAVNGILSHAFDLNYFAEPTNDEDHLSNNRTVDPANGTGVDGRGRYGEKNINSNLTIDFGFVRYMSLGNRVWDDSGVGTAPDAGRPGVNVGYNNGIQDGTEPGIGGVTLELYRTDAGGTPIGGALQTTMTDANGHYLFDSLYPDNYVVVIPASNFQGGGALINYDSSDDATGTRLSTNPADFAPALNADRNDNGVDDELPANNGIRSLVINLAYDAELTGETDLGTNGLTRLDAVVTDYGVAGLARGRQNQTDANSDLAIDFGFVQPRFSIGNYVWYDYNNNGQFDTGFGDFRDEQPAPGVVLRLYASSGTDAQGRGIPTGGILRTVTTDVDGYYLFDNLTPGNYVIWIIPENFREAPTEGPLYQYRSSTGVFSDAVIVDPVTGGTRIDTRDNGVDEVNPVLNGVYSATINLTKNQAPIGETELSNNNAHGVPGERRGLYGQLDSNSDLTRDFSFYKPMSIGNRIWLDTNNNGVIDVDESGIPGVTVQLWQDTNRDGTYDTLVDTELTSPTGHYLFDNLRHGDYIVVIPDIPANNGMGGPLNGLAVTDGVPPYNDAPVNTGGGVYQRDDNRNNGQLDNTPGGTGGQFPNGVVTTQIQLRIDQAPRNETDLTGGIGTNGETNRNSDLTRDIGFYGSLLSLGNRVWFDPNNNGIEDASEANNGIAGVTVSLYRDNDSNGIPDGIAFRTTTTDSQGYYLFDNLPPGNYIVGLNNANFNAAQPLQGLRSSTGNYAEADNTLREDRRDAGRDALNATFGLLSHTVVLDRNSEPINEVSNVNPLGFGAGGVDANANMTIDFGLYRPLSVGNRVWFDLDNSGHINGTENGAGGVTLSIFYEDPGNPGFPGVPVVDPTNPANPYTTTTDANGYYIFDGLGQGTYIIVVDGSNFDAAGALVGMTNSTGALGNANFGVDNNNNGISPIGGNTALELISDGIRSNPVTLTLNTMPTNEQPADLSGNPAHGAQFRGRFGELNNNSDLTIDFGVVPSSGLTLGNRVWFDTGAGADFNNGVQDAGELGVVGVTVNLYRDVNGDGIPDTVTPLATTTTNDEGRYLFEGLTPGNYIVQLAPNNFQPGGVLEGYGSTFYDAGQVGTDQWNNGLPGSAPTVNGILSDTVNLVNPAPLGEDIGNLPPSVTDDNTNLTVDFGLVRYLSLGNRVWRDTGGGALTNNGLQDAAENNNGVAGVTLELYFADVNGEPDFANPVPNPYNADPVYTVTTDNRGYYLFDRLLEGDYVVVVTAGNFNGAGSLVGMTNSTPTNPDPLTGETDTDRNDNGINVIDPTASGVNSNRVQLRYGTQPTNETDLSGNAALHGTNSRGRNGEANNNSNLTIDFSFFVDDTTFMSIGNRVWIDDGAGGGTANDGIQNGGEVGVDGVTVQLFASTVTGEPIGAALQTFVTEQNGYYLFDNLPPGNYVVVIPASNFGNGAPLYGLLSSDGAYNAPTVANARDDERDNGIDVVNPAQSGVRSGRIQLVLNAEATGETSNVSPLGIGANNVDANSNQTVDFGFLTRYDYGDNPDAGQPLLSGGTANYGTTNANNGPNHRIVGDLYMGNIVDAENDGQPEVTDAVNTAGDNANGFVDEDGVRIPNLVAGTVANVEVTVFNNTGRNAYLVGWIDLNGDGVFDAGEAQQVLVPSSATAQNVILPFAIPTTADIDTGGTGIIPGETYARFRLTTDTALFVGGNPANDPLPTGRVNDGEIEDYFVRIQPPGIFIDKTNNTNAIVVGQATTYIITISNSHPTDTVTRPFIDIVDARFINVTWTCTANAQASCSLPGGAGNNIGLNLTLNPAGEVIITVNATLDPATLPPPDTIVNTAIFGVDTADDTSGIIFDPPFGVKTGQVLGGNVIRWTMVWLNTGAPQAATITDVLPLNQTFAGNLVCTPFGATITTDCDFNAATRTVSWTGTIATGNVNRLEISFDVIVPGPGTYTNTATLTTPGPGGSIITTSANGVVTIPGTPVDSVDDVGGGFGVADPAISKVGEPQFAQPGEEVVWTVTVSNPGGQPAVNPIVTDVIPGQLDVLGGSASSGTLTLTGTTYTWTQPILASGDEVTITIVTRVKADALVPFIVTNTAVLEGTNFDRLEASANLVSVLELPATGETPLYAIWLRGLLVLAGLSLIGGAGVVMFLRRRPS